jgi:glycosyltransferase involved in cell wall biosynthesis
VKLQALSTVFPNSPRRFNLLYLVSSGLPAGAVALAGAARKKGIRIVVNQNGVAYPGWYGRGWERLNVPMAELLGMADHVFYQSDFCRMAADEFLRVQPPASETLYNAVDTSLFSPAPPVVRGTGPVLLLAGSQEKSYRVSTALEVLAIVARRLPEAKLIVTGRLGWCPAFAEGKTMALRWARELGVEGRVTFTGPYTQAQAVDLFRRADILLHTKYNDPCPTVVLEAMACGLPVVYSSTGGVPELVGSEGGIGVPGELRWDREAPPDPALLADAVLNVTARQPEFSDRARRRAVDRFDVRAWLRRHSELFEELTA